MKLRFNVSRCPFTLCHFSYQVSLSKHFQRNFTHRVCRTKTCLHWILPKLRFSSCAEGLKHHTLTKPHNIDSTFQLQLCTYKSVDDCVINQLDIGNNYILLFTSFFFAKDISNFGHCSSYDSLIRKYISFRG